MQNLLTFEKALKDNYLPVWQNQLGTEPSALLSKIKKIPLKSNKVKASAPVGLSGGFGFGAESKSTPQSGGVKFDGFETVSKDMYVNICISTKAVRLTNSGGAMADALNVEVNGAYETAKWNVGRSLFGNGTGKLADVTALSPAGNVITVTDVSKLKEGLIVDFYANGAAVDSVPAVAGRRIAAIDRISKKITIEGNATTLAAGFVTVQNSYGREITGLGAIYDPTITSIYGVSKTAKHYLNPIVEDAVGDIDDRLITRVLRNAERDKNSKVDMILCGDNAYDSYVEYLRTNNVRVEEMSKTLNGGFKAIKFTFGNREVDIVNESFVPTGEMWGIPTSNVELHMQEWDFANLQGGGIFNLMENQSVYRALLANYGELICTNPGGCVRIHGIA